MTHAAPTPTINPRRQLLGKLLLVSAVFALLLCLAIGWFDPWLPTARSSQQSIQTRSLSGTAHGAVQVYFTRPQYPEQPGKRDGGLDQTVAADIEQATRSVNFAAFDLDLTLIVNALTTAHQRGVDVRVILDSLNLQSPEVAAAAGALQDAGIAITFDRRPAFMHNKILIIDETVVWTGSWNPTGNDTFRNNNNAVRVSDPRIAAQYSARFDALYAGQSGDATKLSQQPDTAIDLDSFRIAVAFAPDDNITGDVAQLLADADESVEFLAFSFTSDPLAEAVIAAHQRGVRVQGVVESRNAQGTGAELAAFQAAGLDVLPDGNCYQMHHKVFIIDGRRVVTGSFNWSANAQDDNDENTITVESDWFAQRYQEEFQRIYAQAREPMRCD